MPYFVYILRTSSSTLYIGQTNNLEKRIKEHQNKTGKSAKYIQYFSSCVLVYSETYSSRTPSNEEGMGTQKMDKSKKRSTYSF